MTHVVLIFSTLLEFWKTLRAIQNENRHVSFIVAGVNASVVETADYGGHDNPLFSMLKVKYMPGFDRGETRQVVRTLGWPMGMRFEEDAYDYLVSQYGGHPLLIRLACSYTSKRAIELSTSRPMTVSRQDLISGEEVRDRSLFQFADHILGMLKRWYPEEHQMLQQLAQGDLEFFRNSCGSCGSGLKAQSFGGGGRGRIEAPVVLGLRRLETGGTRCAQRSLSRSCLDFKGCV